MSDITKHCCQNRIRMNPSVWNKDHTTVDTINRKEFEALEAKVNELAPKEPLRVDDFKEKIAAQQKAILETNIEISKIREWQRKAVGSLNELRTMYEKTDMRISSLEAPQQTEQPVGPYKVPAEATIGQVRIGWSAKNTKEFHEEFAKEALRKVPWILCKDELPEKEGWYEVTHERYEVPQYAWWDGIKFLFDKYITSALFVAWRPILSEPYKEKG